MEGVFRRMITQRLMKLDPTLVLHNEGEWGGNPTSKYSAFNDGGVECEVGEYLFGLVRLLKPNFVLETGSHHGVGASYLGMALKENKQGLLTTIEFLPANYEIAKKRIEMMGLNDYVECLLMDVKDYKTDKGFDLILLDTEPQTRFQELLQFYNNLNEGGFIFIHDLHRHMHQIENEEHGFAWPYGKIPQGITDLVKADKLRPFHFTTPRGISGFYKPSKEDYVWSN